MGAGLEHVKRVKEARKLLEDLMQRADRVLVIHYSCESFYDRADGRTPRITSIAVRSLQSGQTHSFSIHKVAEVTGTAPPDIQANYDVLERRMLDEFFDFTRQQNGSAWLHWNMRDINYGFAAIEHRYSVLGGTPYIIEDTRKYDLSRLLVRKYGIAYIGHPRLEKLMHRNDITTLDFLNGAQEAETFEKGDFVRLHQSTLRKVDVLASLVEHAANGSLKTKTRWYAAYGYSWAAAGELVKEHWFFVLLGLALAVAGLVK